MQAADNFYIKPDRLYFKQAAQKLCQTAGVGVAGITECVNFSDERLRILALYRNSNEEFIDTPEYDPADTPCRAVIDGQSLFYPSGVRKLFPRDRYLVELEAEAYCAAPLKNSFAEVVGSIFIIDSKPLAEAEKEKYFSILSLFATPIALELESQQHGSVFNHLVEALNIRKGPDFFSQFARYIQNLLKADCVLLSEITDSGTSLRALAACCQGKIKQNMAFDLAGAPGRAALEKGASTCARAARRTWPDSEMLKRLKAESYVGLPLVDLHGGAIGLIEVVNTLPVKNIRAYESLLKVFAARAADELNRVRDERELSRYRDMINASTDLIAIIDRNYRHRYVNKNYLDFYHQSEARVINHDVAQLHGGEVFNGVVKPGLDKCLAGETVSYEINCVRGDGSPRYLRTVHTPYYADKNQIRGVIAVSHDLTEYVETTGELDRSREYINKIIRLSPDLIWLASLDDDEIIDVNAGFCSATGWDRQELIGEATTKIGLYTLDFRNKIVALILKEGEINGREFHFRKKNGEPIYVVASSFFVELSGEKRILTIAKDITERKHTEILLELESRCYQIEAENDDFDEALTRIIAEIESRLSESTFSISLLDSSGKRALKTIAPGLPEKYRAAMAGPGIKKLGGRLAAARQERAIASDIEKDAAWRDCRGPALKLGLKTCWSAPIKSSRQELTGALSSYHKYNREPAAFENMMLYRIAAVVGAIIEHKMNDERLRESRKKFRTLYHDAPSMFFSLDSAGRIMSVNEFGAKYLGYKADELIGRDLIDTLILDEDRTMARAKLNECFTSPDSLFRWELRKKHRSGHAIWVRETAHVINMDNRQEILVVCDDISENQRLAQQLEYQATHDALTRLVNRREFEQRLARLLKSGASRGAGHAACYLDLDNFKLINDTCGHIAGDAMLKQLSELLAASVRGRDTLARLGGDEFGILIENCTLDQAHGVAKKILSVVQDFRFAWDENKFSVGVSIGLVPISETSGNVTDVLSAADSACYMAKELGRNRIHVFSLDDDELEQRRDETQWVFRINQALEENQLDLFYQEIVPLKPPAAGEGKRLELLIRIKTADGGYILPGAFLPAAERHNLSDKIDQWVIQAALDWLCSDEKILTQVETCAINISGHSLGNDNFLNFCIQKLKASRLPPGKLCFEISETIAIANLGNTRKFITALKGKGCSFALDDFGSGLSSFGYLKNLPVDYIKIDGAFIRDLLTDSVDREMVATIRRVGQIVNKKTIAEFVENDETRQALLEIGIDYAQGYAIAKPRPIKSFLAG